MPRKAIILAAGFGERMLPLTARQPKAMMPFAGAPVIEHTLKTLSEWGVRDVLINLHHAPSKLLEYFQHTRWPDLRISFSFEPEIRGTGGAIRQAEWFIDETPFWMVNSDIIFELNPRTIVREFNDRNPVACLWVTSASGPLTVDVRNGIVKSFSSDSPGTADTVTFCGLHLIDPDILPFVPDEPFSSIITAYTASMAAGRRICAVEDSRSYWADIGSPEKLLSAHMELAKQSSDLHVSRVVRKHCNQSRRILHKHGVTTSGFVSLGSIADVAPSASVSDAILGHDVSLGSRTCVKNCVAADSAKLRGGTFMRAALPLRDALSEEDECALISRGWNVSGYTCEALPPRGSDRTFYRVRKSRQSCILIKYRNVRTENALFTQNLKFLKSLRIPVPDLILDLPENNLCIVQDLGSNSLQSASSSLSETERMKIYSSVIKHVARIHAVTRAAAKRKGLVLDLPFDEKLYRWEHDLFAEQYLAGHLKLERKVINRVLRELHTVALKMMRQQQHLIHRDLQSSNIMLLGNQPVFIDFQGMRLGSQYYDLASLLLDPYITIHEELRARLVRIYSDSTGIGPATVERNMYLAGIQRLSQAIGAYCRLSRLAGMGHFSQHIAPALNLLSQCLSRTETLPILTGLLSGESSTASKR